MESSFLGGGAKFQEFKYGKKLEKSSFMVNPLSFNTPLESRNSQTNPSQSNPVSNSGADSAVNLSSLGQLLSGLTAEASQGVSAILNKISGNPEAMDSFQNLISQLFHGTSDPESVDPSEQPARTSRIED